MSAISVRAVSIFIVKCVSSADCLGGYVHVAVKFVQISESDTEIQRNQRS